MSSAPLSEAPFVEAKLRVLYADTDAMGVVYHGNYFRYFEASRGEFLRSRGTSYRAMEAQGTFIPMVDVQCRYHSPAKYDDVLVIKATVDEVRGASFAFVYEVRREGESALVATGRTVHACINGDGRPVRLTPAMVELLGGPRKGSPSRS